MNPYQSTSTEAEDWEPEDLEPEYWKPEYWEGEHWKRESRGWKRFLAIVAIMIAVVVLYSIVWRILHPPIVLYE